MAQNPGQKPARRPRRNGGSPPSVYWVERLTESPLPPMDERLSRWTIDQKRASHWNGHTRHRGRTFYLKWFLHGPLMSPARTEWNNARRVAELRIPTVSLAGWGKHPHGSFCVLEGSPGFPVDAWRQHEMSADDLRRLAQTLAVHIARLHGARLCHRDLNVYHVLVHGGMPRLLDVGRVRPFVRRRWIIKDLASLLDTARREGLPAQAARTFIAAYLKASRVRWSRRRLLSAVDRKARRYRRHNEKHER